MAASGFGGFKFGSTATSTATPGASTGFSFGAKTTAPTLSFGSQPKPTSGEKLLLYLSNSAQHQSLHQI